MPRKFKITFNAPVTLAFVFICFLVTLAGEVLGDGFIDTFFVTWHSSLTDPLTYVRFVTHVFGHAGWEHFIGNAAFLLLLGPMLEEKHGSAGLVKVILITAVATGLINYLIFWNVGLCGASGVVFAFIVLASFTGFNEGEIPLTFILVAAVFLGQEVYEGVILQDDVSQLTHIIGGIVGAVVGYLLNRRRLI